MIGRLDPREKQVTVVGAGFAGLIASYCLERAGYEVTLHETQPRTGGLIVTQPTPFGPSEGAAHSLLATPALVKLCAEIGVELVAGQAKARYIWRNGRMRRVPLGMLEALATAGRLLRPAPPGASDDPGSLDLETWGRRHLGAAAVDYLLNPFLRGIYAARPSELLVAATYPQLLVTPGESFFGTQRRRRREARAVSTTPAPRSQLMAPRFGMQSLTDALAGKLSAPRLGPVDQLPDAPNIVLCVPVDEAARLLAAADPSLYEALAALSYSALVSATVFAENRAFANGPPQGVGVLMPEREPRDCLGILFNSASFPNRIADPERFMSCTMMFGGSARPQIIEESDTQLTERITLEMQQVLGLRGEPAHVQIWRRPRAIPQYGRAAWRAWETARAGWCARPGRVLFGNWAGEISLRTMTEAALRLVACCQ